MKYNIVKTFKSNQTNKQGSDIEVSVDTEKKSKTHKRCFNEIHYVLNETGFEEYINFSINFEISNMNLYVNN